MMSEQKTTKELAKLAKKIYMQEYMGKYRKKNRLKIREAHKKWQRENPEKVRAYQEKFWAKKAQDYNDKED